MPIPPSVDSSAVLSVFDRSLLDSSHLGLFASFTKSLSCSGALSSVLIGNLCVLVLLIDQLTILFHFAPIFLLFFPFLSSYGPFPCICYPYRVYTSDLQLIEPWLSCPTIVKPWQKVDNSSIIMLILFFPTVPSSFSRQSSVSTPN